MIDPAVYPASEAFFGTIVILITLLATVIVWRLR